MFSFLASLLLLLTPLAHADTQSDIQSQIDANTAQISDLKDQIAKLQSQLDATTKQKQTLQTAVSALDLNIKKITTQITLTNTQISQKDKEISRLSGGIATTTATIGTTRNQIGDALRGLNELDGESMAAQILSGGTLSDFFNEAVALGTLRDGLQSRVDDLSDLKDTLTTNKNTAQNARAQLAALQTQLGQQKQSLAIARQSQNDLLTQTKNQESSYQALIAQKKAEEAAFEAELIKLAKGLGTADTSSAASPQKGIFAWPLDSITITQYFGNTEFAQSGAYNGQGHNGVDFRASIGTPVKAVLTGTVQEINQGAVKNCQYGKWVLVKHDNGLTSLYAHLSSIAVTKGERVSTGEVLGYSGDTGYATGPHLHLTVYVSSAVTFKTYTCNSGKTAYIPISPLNAYLNPLSYLP
ncbi:MAG TPA: peptidoglycan DD-metalloendopeptidase family protein [Candidatus Paceibacterota bacterium]|nr:peptidoglycan DD-metalloendopeptidase family protein [Candidatus Paceibacterota bacterium]